MKKSVLNQALTKSIRTKYFTRVNGAHRFKNFQRWLLEVEIAPDIQLFLSLFAMDGLRVGDHKLAIRSRPMLYTNEKIGIGWLDQFGRQQRIQLGAISTRLLASVDWNHVQRIPLKTLADYYVNFCGNESALESFINDQLAWFSEIASGPLVEHFSGQVPMTALADDCYARLVTKQALYLDTEYHSSESDSALYQAMDGWLEPRGNDDNPIFIDRIVQICRRQRIDDRKSSKVQLINDCQDVLQEATDAGPVISLILSWTLDLVLHGTVARADVAVSTVTNYVGVLSRPLFKEFRHKKFTEWNIAQYETVYSKLIFEASAGQRKNMASAINSWHRFLVSWLDVPPLIKRLHDEVPVSVPLANVLWEHEYQLIQRWLASAIADKRLILYLSAMFNLAFNIRIRINELLKLRMEDIQFFGEFVQISIHGTKSLAAKRRIEISKACCNQFFELVQLRQAEFALANDFLFADPNRVGRVFKISKLFTCASHLLKAASGDPSIRFHALSHTVISAKLPGHLVGGSDHLTNPLHQLATDFGHFSILTSCSEYMHCYEDAVRETIDKALAGLRITSDIAAKWSDQKSAAIRKRSSRGLVGKNTVYWQVIFASQHGIGIQSIDQNYQLSIPTQPSFINESNALDFFKILNVFSDIQNSLSIDLIILRQSSNADEIRALLQAAKKILINSDEHSINFKSSSENIVQALLKMDWLSFNKALSGKYLSILNCIKKTGGSYTKGLDAWLLLNKSGYLSLADQVLVFDLLELLSILGAPVTQLAIAYNEDATPQELRLLQSIFFKNFGSTVPQFYVKKRGGRPDVYLLYSSQHISANEMPPPAALSVDGLNAIFFVLAVLMEVGHEK